MKVKSSQVQNSQPIIPVEKKSIWSQIKEKISACWKKCFPDSSPSNISASKPISAVKLTPITKASPFTEASWIMSNVSGIINARPPVSNLIDIPDQPPVNLPPKAVKKPAAVVKPKLTEAQINEKRMDERNSVILELNSLSVALKNRLGEKPSIKPRAHHNFSNTCYMNAALQSLSASYGFSLDLDALISNDLSRPNEDSYDLMEERLSTWAPIKVEEMDLRALQSSQKKLEDQMKLEMEIEPLLRLQNELAIVNDDIRDLLNIDEKKAAYAQYRTEFNSADDLRRATLKDKMINLEQDLCLRQDRILFKWSFLLYMQACKYGSDDQVKEALGAHHRVCFAIARHMDFESTPGSLTVTESHEISTYMQLFHSMLGLGINSSFHKQYVLDGKPVFAGYERGVDAVVNVVLKKDRTFLHGLAETFSDVSTVQIQGVPLPAEKITDIRKIHDTPPRVLTLNVNGDRRDTPLAYSSDKKDKKTYLDVLDLRPYFDQTKIGSIGASYRVMGLSIHTDKNGKNGHYYSYVRRKKEGSTEAQWFRCNDSAITPVGVKDVPFDRATTLTYVQVKGV